MKLPRWLAATGVVFFTTVTAAGLCLAIYAAWMFKGLPGSSELAEYRPPTATRVFAYNGELIGEFGRERRIIVPYEDIPPMVRGAFLSAEDRRFFVHSGVDMTGLGRALVRLPMSFVQGRRPEGGSTITQQVAKNVLLTNDVTIGRKVKEAILARRLEQALTKPQILELYLNEIWLGRRAYGVAAAAANYFNKPLEQLTIAEAAYLAALPKGPSNYNPTSPARKAAAIGRRNWVLGQMAESGVITVAEARAAAAEDLVLQEVQTRVRYRDADFFVEEVRRRALESLGPKMDEGGYYVRTTLDPKLQTYAREALMDGLESYDRRHGWRGAWGTTELVEGWQADAKARSLPAERRSWQAAIVQSSGGRVQLADGTEGTLAGEDVAWAKRGKGLNPGDLVFAEPVDGRIRLRQIPEVNGALVAVEPKSGRVLALVGGYSFSLSKYNRATQAYRQPGSAFKPFVYATAMERGYTPASVVSNGYIRVGGYSPENYNRRFGGFQTLRTGLTYSYNAMTVRLAQRLGIRRVRDDAVKFGAIRPNTPANLAMALGAAETTPLALTGAYAAFANGGLRVEPHLMELITDRDGKSVLDADTRQCRGCDAPYTGAESPRLPPYGKAVMDPVSAYQITSMLESVVQKGTARAATKLNRPLAGKTGTTNDYRSAWFVGYSPQLIAGVFVGFDDNRSLGRNETGGHTALPVFIDFAEQALKDEPKLRFVAPKVAKIIQVRGTQEAFKPGTEPKRRVARTEVAREGGSSRRTGSGQGPIPYSQAWSGERSRPAAAPTPAPAPAAPAPAQPAQDLSGLY